MIFDSKAVRKAPVVWRTPRRWRDKVTGPVRLLGTSNRPPCTAFFWERRFVKMSKAHGIRSGGTRLIRPFGKCIRLFSVASRSFSSVNAAWPFGGHRARFKKRGEMRWFHRLPPPLVGFFAFRRLFYCRANRWNSEEFGSLDFGELGAPCCADVAADRRSEGRGLAPEEEDEDDCGDAAAKSVRIKYLAGCERQIIYINQSPNGII
jgi:hypothetical protein